MSDNLETHTPAPEFSESLARDVVRLLRYESRFEPSRHRGRRLGAIIVSMAGVGVALTIGLIFGTNTGYASARVEGDRQRNEIAGTMATVTTGMAALRLDLERARSDMAHRAAEIGAVPQSAFRAAESELRAMEASAERMELDLSQSQGTTRPFRSRAFP